MNATTNFAELISQSRAVSTTQLSHLGREGDSALEDPATPAEELSIWLRAFGSYFNPRHHPFTETERAEILERNFLNETHIVQAVLVRCSKLITDSAPPQPSAPPLYGNEFGEEPSDAPAEHGRDNFEGAEIIPTLAQLTESFGDVQLICSSLLDTRRISFRAWSSVGNIIEREIARSEGAGQLAQTMRVASKAKFPPVIHEITERVKPDALSADLLSICFSLTELLRHLRFVNTLLRRDQPLKQTLPIFTLVHQDTRNLLDFFETRGLRIKGLASSTMGALDGAAYAIVMETRKAFEHELVGLSGAQQAPVIYAKVENAHGLLRDCFQQSLVGLAQAFEGSLDGTQIFPTFQTKLEQSLILRRDLWVVLQYVRRAGKERDQRPVTPLLARLIDFREGSMRFLMYKDWESYERFLEEVAGARGAAELAPVLHRFGAYLETLFGQINMRAVFSDHPFDYPAVASSS